MRQGMSNNVWYILVRLGKRENLSVGVVSAQRYIVCEDKIKRLMYNIYKQNNNNNNNNRWHKGKKMSSDTKVFNQNSLCNSSIVAKQCRVL